MKFYQIIFARLFLHNFIHLSLAFECFRYLNDAIINQIKPYQVTVFSNNSLALMSSRATSKFMAALLTDLPIATIDFQNVLDGNQFVFGKSIKTINDTKYMSLNIILTDKQFYQDKMYKIIIDFLALLSPVCRRQKVMLLSLDTNISPSDEVTKDIFQHAWNKKFLDFTAIQIFNHTRCTLQYLNPFKSKIMRKKLINANARLFPDKLTDVYGFTVKIGVIYSDPITMKIKDRLSNQIVDVKTELFYLLSTALEKMNFSRQFVEVGVNKSFLDGSLVIDEKLRNHEINFYVKPRSYILSLDHVLLDIETECEKIIALVPSHSVATRVLISADVIISFFLLPLLIVLIYAIVRLFRLRLKKWKVFDIIKVFFGRSIICPKDNVHRVIYPVVVAVSAIFSFDFYSNFLKVGLTKNEDLFNTLKDISKSDLKFYTFGGYHNAIFQETDQYSQSIKRKVQTLSDSIVCLENLALYDDRICIVSEGLLRGVVKYQTKLKIDEFFVAKPTFNCLKVKYSYLLTLKNFS